ncbi:MAG: hypothetical protein EOO28_23920 [Comamonadaceae bacterium]|nr:MAG: hypothetical protein EOO28_23920 [Comamonadaceae bacterium]
MSMLGSTEASSALLKHKSEEIRQLMLREIGQAGEDKHPGLVRRVLFARDIQGLWYLRSEVMAVMANTYGETLAREKMERISSEFKGLLPGSLAARPSSLKR